VTQPNVNKIRACETDPAPAWSPQPSLLKAEPPSAAWLPAGERQSDGVLRTPRYKFAGRGWGFEYGQGMAESSAFGPLPARTVGAIVPYWQWNLGK
jgi:hypothetical protein